jgi:hypothetical protein
MPRKSNNNKKRKSGRKRRNNSGITANAQTLKVVPSPRNTPFRIRRSWEQSIGYYGANGWFNLGSSDFQINFAASTSNINIGGVAVYGPTTAGSAELSAMFDQYKLLQVTVRIDWNYNSYPVGSGNAVAPLMNYVVDYDDSGSAIMGALLQYPGMKTHSFLQNGYTPLIVSCKPKPLRDIASTGILTSYGPMTSAPWIRTADMTTPHYGLKFCATQFGLGGVALIGNITITCFIDMELANPK